MSLRGSVAPPPRAYAEDGSADTSEGERPGWKLPAAASVLVAGAFGVMLAGLESVVFDLDRYLVPKALVLHLTAAGLLALGFPSLRRARWGVAEWLLIAFVLWSALSAAFATNRWLALSSWGVGVSTVLVLLASREIGRSLRWQVLAGLVAAAVVGAGLGIAQAYGADWRWLADTRPPGATFGNRNFLAHFSVLVLPPLVVMVSATRRRAWLLPALLGLATLVAAVVLTRSRAAWLGGVFGVLVAVGVLLVYRRLPRPPAGRTVAAVLAVVLAIGAAVLLPNRLRWTADSPYVETLSRLAEFGEGSGRGRLIQYGYSLDLVREAPLLGVGPGNWFVHYPRVTGNGDPSYAGHLTIPTNPWPSSDWVAFVSERGVGATLLLLLAGALGIVRALTQAGRGEGSDAAAAAALTGLLTATVVTGSFDAVLLLAAPSLLVASAAGLLLPDPARRVPLSPTPATARALRLLTGAVLVVLVSAAGAHTAAISLTGERRDQATLARAARLAPGDHRLQLLMAEAGDCAAAGRALALMPHHAGVEALARKCGH